VRALTLTQPWATAVATGIKRVETRSWRSNYRGPLLICSGSGLGPAGGARGLEHKVCETLREWFPISAQHLEAGRPIEELFPLGKALAVCMLVAVRPTLPRAWTREDVARHYGRQQIELGDFTPGRYAWIVRDVRRIAPTPVKGRQRLWKPDLEAPDLAMALAAA
jgi:hypothetical protein